MKTLTWLVVLGALVYGGMWLYNHGLGEALDNTVSRTADFATDKNVKEANF